MDNRNFTLAKAYVEKLGWSVFPIVPKSKAPLTKNGFKDATKNLDQIKEWWTKTPKAGIGIPTGDISGIIVLDVDPRNGGDISLERLVDEYGQLPDTVHSLTGGGGSHYFFRYDERVKKTSLADYPGLDFQGNGKYIVAPGSIHPNGRSYEFEESSKPVLTPIAPLPEWLVTLISINERIGRQTPQRHESSYWGDLMKGISEGGRNQAATSLIGHLLRRYVHPDIVVELVYLWNSRNTPPLDPSELEKIFNSIAKSELQRRQEGGIQ